MTRWSLALFVTFIATVSVTFTSAEVVGRESCSFRNAAVIEENAQVFLGGLLEFSTSGGSSYGCGGPASSMQYLLVGYTVNLSNLNSPLKVGPMNDRIREFSLYVESTYINICCCQNNGVFIYRGGDDM